MAATRRCAYPGNSNSTETRPSSGAPLEKPADLHYAGIRWTLEQRGEPIGPNDLLIAAHALALESTLVTANVREFSRVPGLQVANWLSG